MAVNTQETLDKIALAALDAINQSKTRADYESWLSRIFNMASPDDDDGLADDCADEEHE